MLRVIIIILVWCFGSLVYINILSLTCTVEGFTYAGGIGGGGGGYHGDRETNNSTTVILLMNKY